MVLTALFPLWSMGGVASSICCTVSFFKHCTTSVVGKLFIQPARPASSIAKIRGLFVFGRWLKTLPLKAIAPFTVPVKFLKIIQGRSARGAQLRARAERKEINGQQNFSVNPPLKSLERNFLCATVAAELVSRFPVSGNLSMGHYFLLFRYFPSVKLTRPT